MRTALCVVVVLLAIGSSTTHAGARCPGRTVVSAERWRIVEDDTIYLACLRSGGPGVEMVGVESDADFDRVVVAGRYIAYETVSNSSSGYDTGLVFGDMRTGRWKHVGAFPARIVVRATGSLAWSGGGDPANARIGLTRLGRRSKVLARGPGVDVRSLRREGNRAVWLEHGKRRSVLMP